MSLSVVFDNLQETVKTLNTSKLMLGISMLLFNIGSKYLSLDLANNQEHYLKSTIARRITLFCIFFVATHDIFISFGLTAVFVVLATGLFNQDSILYILPSYYDSEYTKKEYEMSKLIIKEYEKNMKKKKYTSD
jgi:hypothetical protein